MPEIRTASSVDGALPRFYAEAFPERAAFLSEHWRWLYRVGKFPGIEPLVLVENGRVVGHAGAIPVVIASLGRKSTAIWFVDFSVLPELQGRGGGSALTEAWMKLCPNRVTFCNERSIRVFRKFGWTEGSGAKVRSQPLELSAPLARLGPLGPALGRALNAPLRALLRALSSGAPALETRPVPVDAGGLAERLDDATTTTTRVVRDADWLRWRLLENPRLGEHVLAEAGGVSAIFRSFTSLGRRRAHLLCVGPGPAAARAAMVKAFARWALDQGADDAWMASSEPALLKAAAPHLWRARPLIFASHSDGVEVAKTLSGPLPTQGIDSDHDLMFP